MSLSNTIELHVICSVSNYIWDSRPGQELPRNRTHSVFAGFLPTPDIELWVFGWVRTRPWFQQLVSSTFGCNSQLQFRLDRDMVNT